MQYYCESLTAYKRLKTLEVNVGDLGIGAHNPIRIQTMTTTDTMDTSATVQQCIRCIEAGAELVRITAPSKKEAENLASIKKALREQGYKTPLVADIHFTPNAAEIAARIVEKVRINPGNYIDKKKFEFIEYNDNEYQAEIDRIRERFTPLVSICKQYGTAMRIGTNHGSLSDRIMSRYGDTPMGMVESAMEFLRIAEELNYFNIVLSMKASNPQVMVQAYRLLIQSMHQELGHCYPLHLGVTEAGDGEDGRIKSAIGIGTLLEDGIGDTIRVSLTEEPEFEIPVCKDLVSRYGRPQVSGSPIPVVETLPYSPFSFSRRTTHEVINLGGQHVPVVIADLSGSGSYTPESLQSMGYYYDAVTDKWTIKDAAADFVYTGSQPLDFPLPGTLNTILDAAVWQLHSGREGCFPLFTPQSYAAAPHKSNLINFVQIDAFSHSDAFQEQELRDWLLQSKNDPSLVIWVSTTHPSAVMATRRRILQLMELGITHPVILSSSSTCITVDETLIHLSIETGALLLDGMGDGIFLQHHPASSMSKALNSSGRNYTNNQSIAEFLNNTAFSILQATRTRISKTEYISCPSCGRTLFDLQETTARIRKVTHHLKGIKIAIMGCIVNGPGEMADADFGYVGSGPGKITLYKGKDIIKRNVPSATAVDELIELIKENGMWTEREA